jgi:inorganic pyrophosphatase
VIRVFIQAAAGSAEKHIYDEQTLEPRYTIKLVRPYPFPYGFVLDTRSEDGDCVDCYVLTARPLAVGDVVACEPAGLLEQFEDAEPDHKVLAVFPDEAASVAPAAGVAPAAVTALRAFIADVFAAFPDTRLELGRLLDVDAARAHVRTRQRVAR